MKSHSQLKRLLRPSCLLSATAPPPARSLPALPRSVPSAATPRGSYPAPVRDIAFASQLRGISSRASCPYRQSYSGRPADATAAPPRQIQLESSLTYTTAVAALIIAGVIAALALATQDQDAEPEFEQPPEAIEDMAESLPGRPGNLTPEQEEKLRKLWQAFFQLSGVEESEAAPAEALADKGKTPTADTEGPKKKRFGVFRKKGSDSKSGATTPAASSGDDDKYGQTKQFQETLASHSPDTIRATIWTMVKHDHPDALLLRFLRARKWDVEKALVMLVSTMHWRHSEIPVDDDIMKNGEGAAAHDEKEGEGHAKKLGADFMTQIRTGKSYLHGVDKQGRPICVVRARLHKQGEQSEEALERYTVYVIETARMVLAAPVDTATIIFDMTGFSLANMDYTPVKFMIKCFEANYPESLGIVLVHNAPWVFQGIWKIIKGWLDPVVAGKVHFTNNKSDLEQYIEPGKIHKELGGDEPWEYKYTEPVAGENDKMKDVETRDRLLQEREATVKEFEAATLQWIEHPEGDEGKDIRAKRTQLAQKLREGYWTLDPYVRARSVYDRQGSIQAGGKVNWYETAETPANNAAAAPSTNEDDVD